MLSITDAVPVDQPVSAETVDCRPDLSLRKYFSYYGRSPHVKWYLPLGLITVVRGVMLYGAAMTLLIIVSMFVGFALLGYLVWRARGGGPYGND